MGQQQSTAEKNSASNGLTIPKEWIHGVYADGTPAEAEAVEVANSGEIYLYPKSDLDVPRRNRTWQKLLVESATEYDASALTLPGTAAYRYFACKALETIRAKTVQQMQAVFFPSGVFKPTEAFKRAIRDALEGDTDNDKLNNLEKVFQSFGYYYPSLIVIGGKFKYNSDCDSLDAPKKIIQSVLHKNLAWEAFGGNTSLLDGHYPDIDEWLESTINQPSLVLIGDVGPCYELFEDHISAEIQRIYKVCCDNQAISTKSLHKADDTAADALVLFSRQQAKVGVARGVHFDGLLSERDAVEWIDEEYISDLMKPMVVQGEPRIECLVRRTDLSTSLNTHSFLPDNFPEGIEQVPGFADAAMGYYINKNRARLQSETKRQRYFVMYVSYKELIFDPKYLKPTDDFKLAVAKALNMKDDEEKYKELENVFSRFGYYYPSSILLGGRIAYETRFCHPTGDSLSRSDLEDLEVLLYIHHMATGVDTVGGSSTSAGYQGWIDSVRNNQKRIRYKSLRPIYEVLDQEQRDQILRLYDRKRHCTDYSFELPRAVHFDGAIAEQQAIELSEDTIVSRLTMLRNYSNQPNIEIIRRYGKSFEHVEKYSSLDIESGHDFPGSLGFTLGSQGAYKERISDYKDEDISTEAPYDVAYIYLPDKFIRATSQFKDEISKALQVGKSDYDTYYALQNVFQRFGYYYPTQVNIGARLIARIPHDGRGYQQEPLDYNIQSRYERYLETYCISEIAELAQEENESKKSLDFNEQRVIARSERQVSHNLARATMEKSIAQSEKLRAAGGDSVYLLWNDVKSWLASAKISTTPIQSRNLRPLYELLDAKDRQQVQLIYENVIAADDRVRYNCPLEFYLEEEEDSENESIPSSPISILQQQTEAYFSPRENVKRSVILKIEPAEPMQSRNLTQLQHVQYGDLVYLRFINSMLTAKISAVDDNKFISLIKACTNTTDSNDMKKLAYDIINSYVSATKYLKEDAFLLDIAEHEQVKKTTSISDADYLWKIVPCPWNSGSEEISFQESTKEEDDNGENDDLPLPDGLERKVRRPSLFLSDPGELNQTASAQDDSNDNYIRCHDRLVLESQVALEGSRRIYLCFTANGLSCLVSEKVEAYGWKQAQWQVHQHLSQTMAEQRFSDETSKAVLDELRFSEDILRQAEAGVTSNGDIGAYQDRGQPACQHQKEQDLQGTACREIYKQDGIQLLPLTLDIGYGTHYYKMIKILRSLGDYKTALRMYEKSTSLSEWQAYYDLATLYRTGFTADEVEISENQEAAFLCYAIGGLLGEYLSALKAAEYYEKGYSKTVGVHYDKALQWYAYAYQRSNVSTALLGIGRVEHALAQAATSPLEREGHRQRALQTFLKIVESEPYARFMVAMYHIYGWGFKEADASLGFQMLLNLVESGVSGVFSAIARCYNEGIGVERDPAKALAYQKLSKRMYTL
ncbi:hypothetical protein EC973_000946 [Apophysomyces ossiformis]|uniref:Uncharacterized protein n=1 Tax=Apophysomyces ossiformis TaxID=679940 RepID=A0A8H7BPZ2_9FUNG|nr:hypothetical protein EC973_000946 [Apophysomyces ossiformis]